MFIVCLVRLLPPAGARRLLPRDPRREPTEDVAGASRAKLAILLPTDQKHSVVRIANVEHRTVDQAVAVGRARRHGR
jgi:hypothetical protein